MIPRILLLFAREPRREAREKGFTAPGAEELFATIADGWAAAAREANAALVVAAPPEDLPAWRRTLAHAPGVTWVPQRGSSFGERLERAVRSAAHPGARVLVVGGDVVPSSSALREAFHALDRGADAVLAPAPDGGVSLLSLPDSDHDLLRSIRTRRRDLFGSLRARLSSRGRSVAVIASAADVDGRSALRALRRSGAGGLSVEVERALGRVGVAGCSDVFLPTAPRMRPAAPRGPPSPA